MHCTLCYIELAPLGTMTGVHFCCDEHRKEWESLHGKIITLVPMLPLPLPLPAIREAIPTGSLASPQSLPTPPPCLPQAQGRVLWTGQLPPSTQLLPLPFPKARQHPCTPAIADPILLPQRKPASCSIVTQAQSFENEITGFISPHSGGIASGSWSWLRQVWSHSPSDLKVMTIALPLFGLLAITPALPKVRVKVPEVTQQQQKGVQKVFAQQWETMRSRIAQRAAVEYVEDFRSGLDEWESRNNKIADWSYDATGSVRPASLAIYQPSADMVDYRFEFLGTIDNKALGCVFRAIDTDNYYAVKLEIVRPGPLPEVHVLRYAMVRGRKVKVADHILPIQVRTDTLYRMEIDVHGNDFTIMAQDKVVDFFSDDTFQRGGVGLFCGKGEAARVRWVEVSHQHDALGRFCAYLAPLGSSNGTAANVTKGGTLN